MKLTKQFNVAVVGATGLVGRKMLQVLEERKFPVGDLRLLASARSVGKKLRFNGRDYCVEELTPQSFGGIQIALFSAGASISKEYGPIAAKAGALVIDNSSAFRMDDDVPLVVPEVNPHDIFKHKGIIANPNCSTIQMVVALKPLHDRWKIKRIVVSTYQSVTGAGKPAVSQLEAELANETNPARKFPHQIAHNVLPQVDIFFDDGYSKEEWKMVNETKKILGDASVQVTATCVRVPVVGGHSEAVNLEFEKPYVLDEIFNVLRNAPGVCLQDDIKQNVYPMPIWSHDKDEVFVGRIRRDETIPNGLNLWIVSDNLRKGAATNAVQIAETWIRDQ
ncbi:MAG: aspartate-semialdehyde dehydrogenase [Ignavibacteria bacterium]|nr:aspartate-semialdehyde dehydrogenase [Ignavibacteria bacterium]MBI3765184.1 aspartate-semialdehyde dehydrogenase [Ignavibacteriales bacterium]